MEPSEIATTEPPSVETAEKVRQLLARLASLRGQRKEAEEALRAMGEDGQKAINAHFLLILYACKRRARRMHRRELCYCAGLLGLLFGLGVFPPAAISDNVCMIGFSAAGILLAGAIGDASVTTQANGTALQSLYSTLDVIARMPGAPLVPLWLELYASPPGTDYSYPWLLCYQKALTDVLNTVQKSDARYFSSMERVRLNRILGNSARFFSTQKPELTLAVLRVLELLEDTSSVPTIEYLSTQGNTPRISKAANASLPRMKMQAAAPAHMLLRGSSSPDDPSDVLLRAASGTDMAASGELLRASDASPAETEIKAELASSMVDDREGDFGEVVSFSMIRLDDRPITQNKVRDRVRVLDMAAYV